LFAALQDEHDEHGETPVVSLNDVPVTQGAATQAAPNATYPAAQPQTVSLVAEQAEAATRLAPEHDEHAAQGATPEALQALPAAQGVGTQAPPTSEKPERQPQTVLFVVVQGLVTTSWAPLHVAQDEHGATPVAL